MSEQSLLTSSDRISITNSHNHAYKVVLEGGSVANITIALNDRPHVNIYPDPHPSSDQNQTHVPLHPDTETGEPDAVEADGPDDLEELGINMDNHPNTSFDALIRVPIDGEMVPIIGIDFRGTVPFIKARDGPSTMFGSRFSDAAFAGHVINHPAMDSD